MSAAGRTGTISAETQYRLASGVGGRVSVIVVHFEASTSPAFVGQISIVGRAQRAGTDDYDRTLLGVAYKNYTTGANATAAITGNALIQIDAAGLDVWADCTSLATGSVDFSTFSLTG